MIKIKIGNKLIDGGKPCFIIAEAGVNHNGDFNLAKKLIDAAKRSGADAIKFQTFKAEGVVSENTEMAEYQKRNIGRKKTHLEMLKDLELNYDAFGKLKKYCDRKKIIFLSTPHSDDAIDFLEPLIPAYKIGSGDLTNLPFLEKIARKKKPIILSTGMASLTEVRAALNAIKKQGNKKIIILHCTSDYPCALEDVNLRAMITIKKIFKSPFGYSDHTLGILVPVMAVSLGAQVLEKHFTLSKKLSGPDHRASAEPKEFKEMVNVIRDTEKVLGSNIKRSSREEERIKKIARKSIVARVDIASGEKIKNDMLVIKRPGTGIKSADIHKVIGKIAKKKIKKESLIRFKDLK